MNSVKIRESLIRMIPADGGKPGRMQSQDYMKRGKITMSKIYAYKTRKELLDHMERIAKREVKHYYTDFSDYDVKNVQEDEPGTGRVWLLRETGTYFLREDDAEWIYAVLNNMRNTCAYYVKIGRDSCTIQKLDLDELEKKYKRLDREAKEQREREARLNAA